MSTIEAKDRTTILESSCRCAVADKYTFEAPTVLFRGAFKYNGAAWVVPFEVFTIFWHFVIRFFFCPIYRFQSLFSCTIGLAVADMKAKLTTKVVLNIFGAI